MSKLKRVNSKTYEYTGDTTLQRNSNRVYILIYMVSGEATVELGGGGGEIPLSINGYYEPRVTPTSEITIRTTGRFIVTEATRSLLYPMVQQYPWVPNFNGVNSYADLLTTFTPTGAGTELTISGIYKSNAATQQLLAPDLSAFALTISSTNVLSFNLLTSVTVNGLVATSGVTVLNDGYFVLKGDLDASADIDIIAANAAFGDNFQTQIHRISLDDTDDTNNSLDIDTVIRSELMPTETSVYNKLDDTVYPELVVNGGFDTDSVWIKQGGDSTSWLINGGVATRTSSINWGLIQDIPYVLGGHYEVCVTITEYTSGTLGVWLGSSGVVYVFPAYIGTHNIQATWLKDFSDFKLQGTFVGSIDNVSVKRTNKVGDLLNLGTTQPYVPQLKGGEIDRSYVDGKSEAYLGDYSVGDGFPDWDSGVRTSSLKLTRYSPDRIFGSWDNTEAMFPVNAILTSKTGAVLKVTGTTINDIVPVALLGTDAQIQAGFQYPNVFRVLEPDADVNSEYYHYNNGGSFPWIP